MSWQRLALLLGATALAVQSLLIAGAAACAAIAGAQMEGWEREEDLLARWHEPLRYLHLSARLDPLRGAYFEGRGRLEALVAARVPEHREVRLETARAAYAQALLRTPRDGILWARQAALSLELERYEAAGEALARVAMFGAFEPPAQRIALTAAFMHWRRLDPTARESTLTIAGRVLIQAEAGALGREGMEILKRFAMIDMTCSHLFARGARIAVCADRTDARQGA